MILIKSQQGFSLPEVLIASMLFTMTFAGSLQLSLQIFEGWDRHKQTQLGVQLLLHQYMTIKAETNDNLSRYQRLSSNKTFMVENEPTAFIKQMSIHVDIASSLRQPSTPAASIASFCVATVPYASQWADIQRLSPYQISLASSPL